VYVKAYREFESHPIRCKYEPRQRLRARWGLVHPGGSGDWYPFVVPLAIRSSPCAPARSRCRAPRAVAIDGARVAAALRWKGLTANDAVKRINARAEAEAAEVGIDARLAKMSQQALSDIVNEKVARCHRGRRDALARLIGPPVTSSYLGGEVELRLPPLRYPPSGRWRKAELSMDSNGRHPGDGEAPLPPRYELEAYRLSRLLTNALDQERVVPGALGHDHPQLDVENAMRWMLSLSFWRSIVFEVDAGDDRDPTAAEAGAFAAHVAAAVRLALAPWGRGKLVLRPYTLRRLVLLLDALWAENLARYQATQLNATADLAIIDEMNYHPAEGRGELRHHLEAVRDRERRRGTPEDTIAALIREGDR
jgi:hypothetical protein